MSDRIALIGYGAIGEAVAAEVEIAAALVRQRYLNSTRQALPGVGVVTSMEGLAEAEPDLVVECAGQPAVREYGEAVLAAGMDLMVISTGAFGDRAFLDELCAVARRTRRRILVPSGATAGLDGLLALREGGLDWVRYTSSKPPNAWLGTPAEHNFQLDALREPTVIHSGPAQGGDGREDGAGEPEDLNGHGLQHHPCAPLGPHANGPSVRRRGDRPTRDTNTIGRLRIQNKVVAFTASPTPCSMRRGPAANASQIPHFVR